METSREGVTPLITFTLVGSGIQPRWHLATVADKKGRGAGRTDSYHRHGLNNHMLAIREDTRCIRETGAGPGDVEAVISEDYRHIPLTREKKRFPTRKGLVVAPLGEVYLIREGTRMKL